LLAAIAEITAAQCRAARGLLDWTQQELADAARIGVATVRLFEGELSETRDATLAVIRHAFELAGAEFIDANGGGPGVRLRKRHRREARSWRRAREAENPVSDSASQKQSDSELPSKEQRTSKKKTS